MPARAKDPDEYLAGLPEEQRAALQGLRAMIMAALPGAEEVISYGIPTFKHKGKSLVSYGAAKNHCSLYVQSRPVMEAHAEELTGYDTSPGTVRFAVGNPLPQALVTKLVKARIAENTK